MRRVVIRLVAGNAVGDIRWIEAKTGSRPYVTSRALQARVRPEQLEAVRSDIVVVPKLPVRLASRVVTQPAADRGKTEIDMISNESRVTLTAGPFSSVTQIYLDGRHSCYAVSGGCCVDATDVYCSQQTLRVYCCNGRIRHRPHEELAFDRPAHLVVRDRAQLR
jgi:hypothetical protein